MDKILFPLCVSLSGRKDLVGRKCAEFFYRFDSNDSKVNPDESISLACNGQSFSIPMGNAGMSQKIIDIDVNFKPFTVSISQLSSGFTTTLEFLPQDVYFFGSPNTMLQAGWIQIPEPQALKKNRQAYLVLYKNTPENKERFGKLKYKYNELGYGGIPEGYTLAKYII